MHPSVVPLLFASLLLAWGGASDFVHADQALRPAWIWASAARHHPQRVEFRKRFHIDGSVQRADLRLATEFTSCELRLGNRTAFILDDYGPWLDLDVTDLVRTGDDVLELRCAGSLGPSAIAIELTITTVDGRRTVLRSGADWQARITEVGVTQVGVAEHDAADWQSAETFGTVAAEFWDADRTLRITPLDDYEQWRRASDRSATVDPARFLVPPGFEIECIHSATEQEGSWISLEFDPQGRLTIGREDQGLLRMTLARDGSSVTQVETIDSTLLECRGLLYADGALFAQANNSRGLYRLDDRDADGHFETRARVRSFPGGVGHGRNDLVQGPDGAVYAIFGDSVELPVADVTDLTSPFREARRGQRTTEGHVLRWLPDSRQWQLFCSGLRNPFGIAFNADGEAFTYDADAEFDMGAPWYRPTRLVHLVSGGDYGWRGRTATWPPYDADHADFTLPSGDIGKGSPTAVKSGERSAFPVPYRRAMFALDWAYGRILACHLLPRGAGYVCRAETFLRGRPLNVTDLDFAPDGSLFVITGGRKTHSDLYRIRWTGGDGPDPERTAQQASRDEFSLLQRTARLQLAALHDHASDPDAVSAAWDWIGHADPMLRDAARTVLEHQPLELWSERAFCETRPSSVISLMLSLTRSERTELIPRILHKLLEVPIASLSGYDRSMLLETWSRCLASSVAGDAPAYEETVSRIRGWYPDLTPQIIAPTGAGRSVNHQLALLAERLAVPDLIAKTLELLPRLHTQEDRLHALFVLRNRRDGWTAESRRTVFETLGELDRTMTGGEGMPGFLRQLREELSATLTESERASLGDLLRPGTELDPPLLSIDRPVVRKWQADDLAGLLAESTGNRDLERGRALFRAALCSRCHRAGQTGGVIGPDLTSVAARFGRRDILWSILEPSRVVDEKYRSEQIVTVDGRVIVGRIVADGDYRSTKLRVLTDPLRPGQTVEIDKSDIAAHQFLLQSPMPTGLLDSFTPSEISDLLAYLEQAAAAEQIPALLP